MISPMPPELVGESNPFNACNGEFISNCRPRTPSQLADSSIS